MELIRELSKTLNISPEKVSSAVRLLDEGNTVPFIARYRTEATGGLDDTALRDLEECLARFRRLDMRRSEILRALNEQGVTDPDLIRRVGEAASVTELEDLYRPWRPRRRTRASAAREKGLEPLADSLLLQRGDPTALAGPFVDPDKGVPDTDEALRGARDILCERISEDPSLRARLRAHLWAHGRIVTSLAGEDEGVYGNYKAYTDTLARMPGHRVLAVDRGEKEGFLKVRFQAEEDEVLPLIRRAFCRPGPCAEQIRLSCEDAWRRLMAPSLEREIRAGMTERAASDALKVFSENLRHLLMQPPVRGRVTLGVDPGFRTGCKLAVVDASGRVLLTGVGHFTLPGQEQGKARAREWILDARRRTGFTAVAIGNGTASRESEAFIVSLLGEMPGVEYMIVSEAGASVYSASKLGAEEFPEMDVSLRSAVSIARRLQDPLAELVKIDPKAIGVGQYQHDMDQAELTRALENVVEDCVNFVGVELSTASAQLLSHVAGIGPKLAENIVSYRDTAGISTRKDLKKVPKMGPRAFEQCAGFLRLRESPEPLDRTAVHPESYAAAAAALKELKRPAGAGVRSAAEGYGIDRLAAACGVGPMTMSDILDELEKPGRDPRDDLPPPVLRRDVMSLQDLVPGMALKGTVRNVVDFGAFVDIGVHEDGLVHVSRMSDRFIRHPSQVVSTGDVVDVWVVEVDRARGRISLSMLPPGSQGGKP